MPIKKYSRLISFLLFIEYGVFLSVAMPLCFRVDPKDEYARQAKVIGAILLLHIFLCLTTAILTERFIRRSLTIDSVSSKLYMMLGALASLPLALLVAAPLFVLSPVYFSSWKVALGFQVVGIVAYFVCIALPYFLIFRRLRKKPSITSE